MKYAKYILILALLAASGACTNDFEDYNTNPNKQSEGSVAPIALLEPLIIVVMGLIVAIIILSILLPILQLQQLTGA